MDPNDSFFDNLSAERLGQIVENSATEIYLFSQTTYQFVLVNQGARSNLGYSMRELRSLTPWDIKPDFSKEVFIDTVAPLISGEIGHLDFETVHRRKDGSDYNVSVRLQLIPNSKQPLFFAAIQDITHKTAIEDELRRTTGRLDAILNNTTMSVFMMDHRQHCVFMNKAAEELTGYKFEETIGRPLHDVVHHTYPDGRPFPIDECAIDRAFPEDNQTQGEEIFVHKDGRFYPVAFTASPMKDETGQTFGTIIEVRDIEEEQKARKALNDFNAELSRRVDEAIAERRRVEAQLVQAQKMEAVGQLTGGVAHDFNNLLQVISGSLQLAKKSPAADERLHQRLDAALDAVARGARLATQLLAFSRQQTLEPKVVNVGRLVRNMDELLRRAIGETIEVETVISGGLWNSLVDPGQLENVLLNLAINARDAMEGQGKLTIEAGNAELDEAYARAHTEVKPGQYVMLAITDTGCGIPADIVDKVFDPFFTTKPVGKGTGLGLSMIFGFVKQSEGHIKIYSEEGQGTTVRIYLPRTREKEDVIVAEHIEAVSGGDETVLIVEDDDAVRTTSLELLRDLGYRVLEANNAENALAIVNSGIAIDLLFTDVVMPGSVSSPELARQAQAKLPNLAVLFTSGYTRNAIVHAGRLDDGVSLISKPFTRERLALKVRELLNEHRNMESSGAEPQQTDKSQRTILVLEDEAFIRLATTDLLEEAGYLVLEAGTISEARAALAENVISVLIADIGLPDGSGLDFITELTADNPSMGFIVTSGRDVSSEFSGKVPENRIKFLNKPYQDKDLVSAVHSFLSPID